MSAAHAAAAKATAFAMPAMKGMAPPEARGGGGFMPPLASLAAIPAQPAVQRTCESCESEEREEMTVQPRLEVGPVGDRFEREADAIAGQVMAMRDADVGAAAPIVQRACSACASDDEPQARRTPLAEALKDEEDAPARALRALASGAAPAVQRACSACSKEPPKARRALAEVELDSDDAAPVRARGAEDGSETIAASDSELTSGGSALPSATRSFFEQRMGRDLSGVRVHEGGGAQALNQSISARAFTYHDHIWLGAGERASPSFTMAHELAHVMQQTAPGPVGPRRRLRASTSAAAVLQRVPCNPDTENLFFAPNSQTAEVGAEQRYLQSLTNKTGVIGEVPIPNGTKYGGGGCAALGQFGRADLVKSSNGRFVGMAFQAAMGPEIPRPWYSPDSAAIGCTLPAGQRLEPIATRIDNRHPMVIDGVAKGATLTNDAGPAFSKFGGSFLHDAARAPTSFEIGEVKFGGTPGARLSAQTQIENYVKGVSLAHAGYENIRTNIDKGSNQLTAGKKPTLTPWTFTAGPLTAISGTEGWNVLEDNQTLVVAKWVKKSTVLPGEREMEPRRCDAPKNTFPGKFYGGHDSQLKSVWLYAWYPDSHPPAADAKGGARYTGFNEIAKKLMIEVKTSPAEDRKPRRRPAASASKARRPAVRRKAKPGKPIPTVDPFHARYAGWKEDRKALAKNFGAYEKTGEFGADIAPLIFNKALKNTEDITSKAPNGKVVPDKSPAMKTAEKDYRNLQIITGPSGEVLGALRFHFGAFFLSVMDFIASVKTKFESFFAEKPKESPSTMAGKALHVFTKILGAIAKYLLPRVTDALLDCAKDGIRKTIEGWIDQTPLPELKAKLQGYVVEAEKLRDAVVGDVAAFVESTFGPMRAAYDAVKDEVKALADIVGLARKAFNAARALACLAGGLETAGIACVVSAADALLGLIGASPTEFLLASLLGTCAAQEIFGAAILGIGKVRELPRIIAGAVASAVRDKLPAPFKGMICAEDFFNSLQPDLPKMGEVTCQDETVPQGSSWQVPPEIDPKILNRPLRPGEWPLAGFDPQAADDAIPPRDEPEPPPPAKKGGGDAPAADAADAAGEAATGQESGSETGDGEAGGGEKANLRIEKGTLKNVTGSAYATFYIHGVGHGFDLGKRPIPEPRNVQISFTIGRKKYQGPDMVSIKVTDVQKPIDSDVWKRWIIYFVPITNYILKVPGHDYQLPGGVNIGGYLGARR